MKTSFILTLLVAISTAAFTQKNGKSKTTFTTANKIKTVSASAKKAIVDSLFKVYYKDYKQSLKSEYLSNKKLRVDVKWQRGARVLNILDAKNETYAPTTIVPNSIIEGDLNNDSLNDILVIIYYNQGSRPRLDMYLYVTENKMLQYHSQYTQHSLGFCTEANDTSGRFFPDKIENSLLIGHTDCLQQGDPGCCPSLEMITYYKFGNGLKLLRQERKKVNR
ncbi:MAG: hypothetical protein ACOVO1_06275 [Chitinophagaceae bacterium]